MVANVAGKKLKGDQNENNLFNVLGIEEELYEGAWEGLPVFEQKEAAAYETVIVRVRDQAALDALAKLLDQPNLSVKGKKKKTCWYPELELGESGHNRLFVWMDGDAPEVRAVEGKE